ncbi:hypothetical protein GCM10023084_70900 [Streptomyces lacrimifluminis]|uniref:Gas vesicle protein n=1 Tax=Streptomyces lacrimifluminis TaxID=1500077 RepID=A0A917L472_9ACTN|nr:gas vesicle protein [Streptomyces lacrimifluminis]GGJ43874.1 hypothetical protein GCM10012282_45900 [Streptomyces lacrimifluminis]
MSTSDLPDPALHSTSAPPAAGTPAVGAVGAMRNARAQLAELLGRTPESVSAISRDGTGWQVDVEVVELERIPDSTSVLAVYRVKLDADGLLLGYARSRRYTRGQVDRQ